MLGLAMALFMAAGFGATQGGASGAAIPATQASPDALDQALQQALGDVRDGKNVEALALLDPIAAAVTNRLSQEKVPVFCAQSAGEAKGYMARATPVQPTVRLIQPRLCTVLFLRAYVLENLQRIPEAVEQLRQLIVFEPDFPHYQVEYGSALRQTGDLNATLAAYRRAAELAAPVKEYALDQAAALRGIGFVLTERGDLDGAEKAYRDSLALAPGHQLAQHELAYIAHLRATGVKGPAKTFESNANPANVHLPDGWKPK